MDALQWIRYLRSVEQENADNASVKPVFWVSHEAKRAQSSKVSKRDTAFPPGYDLLNATDLIDALSFVRQWRHYSVHRPPAVTMSPRLHNRIFTTDAVRQQSDEPSD